MSTAFVQTPYCRIKLHSERLVVLAPPVPAQPDQLLQQIPLLELEQLTITEDVQITSQAVGALLRRGLPLTYLDARGQILGQTLATPNAHSALRLRQYQRTLEPAFGLAVARQIVAAKILNQRRVIQRAETNHPGDVEADLLRLEQLASRVETAQSLDELRGLEGAASATYYPAWASFLPAGFPFERRSRRPPHNPVNACLSYAAVLLYAELVALIHRQGLDPGLGTLHSTDDGRWSLALDLMEPFRPAVVEAATLRAFTLGVMTAAGFEPHEGGVYLNPDGRRKFLEQYHRRLDREFLSEHAGQRTTLRSQLAATVLGFKQALDDPAGFRPFRLN